MKNFCIKCGIERGNGNIFVKNKNICIICNRKYYKKNKNKISKRRKELYKENRSEILEKRAQFYKENKTKASEYNKKYYKNNKNKIYARKKQYRKENNKYNEYMKLYRKENKDKILKTRKKYNSHRSKIDPCFKIRILISGAIYAALSKKSGSKQGKSCLQFLQYTIEELKDHIENQFKQDGNGWMNWGNWGIYNTTAWKDNDLSTWVWQLDHIIPQSTFKYISMDCEEFRKCWALENLRPYSAKQNNIDKSYRTELQIKEARESLIVNKK